VIDASQLEIHLALENAQEQVVDHCGWALALFSF